MAVEVKELDGRKWSDTNDGGSVKRRFRITGLAVGFTPAWNYTGLPKIGDVHPALGDFVVASREFEEGQGKEKTTVIVTVNYSPVTTETSGTGEDARTIQVDEWGWDDGTDERELVTDVDGTQVLNSAGDPFDSVPKVMTPAPTFTKIMRFKARQTGWSGCNCKVNNAPVTIGGVTYAAGTLLCTVSEKRIIGDKDWKYSYSVHLKYKSNKVNIEGESTATEIGWDVAVLDAGMRALQTVGNEEKKVVIRVIDQEKGVPCVVTSPALLDGGGHVRSETDPSEPYNFRFKAYERVSIPSWFYSEPTLLEEGLT